MATYHFEVLNPLPDNTCHNPVKCYYPSIPHYDCGEHFIVTRELSGGDSLQKKAALMQNQTV